MNSIPQNREFAFGYATLPFRPPFRAVGVAFGATTLLFFAMVLPAAAQTTEAPWGEPSNGLRCRMVTVHSSMSEEEVDLSQGVANFQRPDDLAFAVELKNVSENSVALLDTRYGDSYGKSKGKTNADWFGQFLFSIDLFDDAGTKVESPAVQVVDVLSPLSGTLVTTIEPGASHRFLLRPMKWLSVMAPRLEAGAFRAVVHYHGLPKDAANHIREYIPDSVALGAWSGNVESLPIVFEIESLANDYPTEGFWGESSDGLRAAVEVVPYKSRYVFGEKPDVKLHVQNVSEKPITLATHLWLSDMQATVMNELGNEVKVGGTWYSGRILSGRITLRPQQTTIIDAGNLAIAANNEQADRFGHVTHRTLVAPAGTYRLQLSGQFGTGFVLRDGKGKQLAPLEGDWSGELTTGFAPLVVASESAHR